MSLTQNVTVYYLGRTNRNPSFPRRCRPPCLGEMPPNFDRKQGPETETP